jgi:hypothetical protein
MVLVTAKVISLAEHRAKRDAQRAPNLFSFWFDCGWWWFA